MYIFVFIAVVACVTGIVLENYKWPQDQAALHARFIEADKTSEKVSLLAGLVLNHSVVRWLIAFATASTLVLGILAACQALIQRALHDGWLSPTTLYVLVGFAVAALMAALSIAARRIAT